MRLMFVLNIVIFVSWSTLLTANNFNFAIENYANDSLQLQCKDDISLNFSNAVITEINQNFITSPIITCLNLMDNNIQKIGTGAFDQLPNLTQLFLSNNNLHESTKLLNFGSHDKLQVLIMNKATRYQNIYNFRTVEILGEYPNLEILSLRGNYFNDFVLKQTIIVKPGVSYATISQRVPFPKLKILDLSENNMQGTNFVNLLPNSKLYFLDLHNNSFNTLNLKEKGNTLFALNLNNNHFDNIYSNFKRHYSYNSLSMADLKNIQYLSISDNKINNIELDAFQDNNQLLYLNLSVNQINYLYSTTFANLQYLKTLDLSHNKLENVPEISSVTEISTLYINSNNIKKIISHAFVQMPKLTKLLIGENQIAEIDVDAFADLSVLEELDLSKNKLTFLPKEWTRYLVSLKYLDLSNNEFNLLESLSLTNTLPLIEFIYLMKNPLEYLNVEYFKNLTQNLTIILIN